MIADSVSHAESVIVDYNLWPETVCAGFVTINGEHNSGVCIISDIIRDLSITLWKWDIKQRLFKRWNINLDNGPALTNNQLCTTVLLSV